MFNFIPLLSNKPKPFLLFNGDIILSLLKEVLISFIMTLLLHCLITIVPRLLLITNKQYPLDNDLKKPSPEIGISDLTFFSSLQLPMYGL